MSGIGLNIPDRFTAIVYKVDNFDDFIFAFLYEEDTYDLLYTDTRYNDKIHYNFTNPSFKRYFELVTNYAKILCLIL